jgi:hypothetical protein
MNSVTLFRCQYCHFSRERSRVGILLQFCFTVFTLHEMCVPSPALEVIVVSIEGFKEFGRILPARKSAFILIRWFVQLMGDDQRGKSRQFRYSFGKRQRGDSSERFQVTSRYFYAGDFHVIRVQVLIVGLLDDGREVFQPSCCQKVWRSVESRQSRF